MRINRTRHTCNSATRYLGAVVGGVDDVCGQLEKNTKVAFEWRREGGGIDERRRVEVRCDHACERGVPFPTSWHYTAANLADAANKAARGAEAPEGVKIACRSIMHIHTQIKRMRCLRAHLHTYHL